MSIWLTRWGWDKVDAISETKFSNAFPCMNMFEFPRLKFHWSLFPRVNNMPALVQAMAWRRSGDKPLSEPMMVSLPTPICVSRPQWINHLPLINKRQMFHDISPNCIRHSWWVNVMRRLPITPWRNIWQLAIVANRFGIYRTSMTWNDRTKYKSGVAIVPSKTDIGKFCGE